MATEKKTKTTSSKRAREEKKKAAPIGAEQKARLRREAVGVVVSDKMQKTIVVKVDRRVRHGMYLKYVTKSRRFKAHDESNEAKEGDMVQLVETRPLSRDKRWALKKIIRRAAQSLGAKV